MNNKQTLVIGDDPTGCNLTGAIFKKRNFSALTSWNLKATNEISDDFDVVLFITNTRHCTPTQAYSTVATALKSLGEPGHFAKRVDSTLRGNLGPESEALLQHVRKSSDGQRVLGLVVAAYPDAHRTTLKGQQYVNEVILSKSAVALDPLNPITESDVGKLMTKDSNLTCSNIFIDQVRGSTENLAQTIRAVNSDLVIFDAETNLDIDAIISALKTLESNNVWVSIDPGAFSVALSGANASQRFEKKEIEHVESSDYFFAFVGSSSDITTQQIEHSEQSSDISWLKVEFSRNSSEQVLLQIDKIIETGKKKIGIVSIYPDVMSTRDHNSQYVHTGHTMAHIAKQLIKKIKPRGIYTSGGDTTFSIFKSFGALGFNVIEEAFPGAVVGNLVGGDFDRLIVLTKGGLIGSDSGITDAFKYLEQVTRKQNYPIGIESRQS